MGNGVSNPIVIVYCPSEGSYEVQLTTSRDYSQFYCYVDEQIISCDDPVPSYDILQLFCDWLEAKYGYTFTADGFDNDDEDWEEWILDNYL